jgi:hypothetical protein
MTGHRAHRAQRYQRPDTRSAPGSLTVITSRARGPLHGRESKLAFARATLSNAVARERLAAYLERVLFVAGRPGFMREPFDAFRLGACPEPGNAGDALLASGTIRSSARRF